MDSLGYSAKFVTAASDERLKPYIQHYGDTPAAMDMYMWNVTLCESLYPAIHCCEIALRNSMFSALAVHFDNKAWIFDIRFLIKRERDTVGAVAKRLEERGRDVNPENVVSEMTLGFWSSLLSSPYDSRIWRSPGLLRSFLPNAPRSRLSIATLHRQLNQLRNFRNRVFHHEPVWRRSDLASKWEEYYEFASWVSEDWHEQFKRIDRFRDVVMNRPES